MVCVEGEILGKPGTFSLHLPLNKSLLHPQNAMRYFEPIYYSDSGIPVPKFQVPLSMIKDGCAVGQQNGEAVPVQVIRDHYVPDTRKITGENAEVSRWIRDRRRVAIKRAAQSYVKALLQGSSELPRVYQTGFDQGRYWPEIIYVSPAPIYGPYRVVSFRLPDREIREKRTMSAQSILMLPGSAVVVSSMALAMALEEKKGVAPGAPVKPGPPGKQKEEQAPDTAAWDEKNLLPDPLLTGEWHSAKEAVACNKRNKRCFTQAGSVCFLRFAGTTLTSDCSYKYGNMADSYSYTKTGKNRLRFIRTGSSRIGSGAIGRTGTARYRLDKDTLTLRSEFDPPSNGIDNLEMVYTRFWE